MAVTWKCITQGPDTNNADYVPQWDGANTNVIKNGLKLETSVGSTGSDSSLVSEQGIREAIAVHKTRALEVLFDGGGSAIATSTKGGIEIPFACTITAARVFSVDNTSGAIAISVWKDTYANYPPTVDDLQDTFSIAASGVKSEETGLSIAVTAGDVILFNVDSCTSIKLALLSLTVVL